MKRVIQSLATVFFFTFGLSSEEKEKSTAEQMMVIKSGEAQYTGREVILTGQVEVQHSLGEISAHRLALIPSLTKEKKGRFDLLKMDDEVHIQLKQGGELFCQEAQIDYTKMEGVFKGDAIRPDVVYLNHQEKREGERQERAPLELKSLSMTMELIRGSGQFAGKTFIRQVEADRQVRVSFNHDYLLLADHAVYQRIPDESSPMAGLLTLTVQGGLPACTMTNLNGDRVVARMIQLNTIDRKLWLTQPEGALFMRHGNKPPEEIEISAQELMWDDQNQKMFLRGKVDMLQSHFLRLKSPYEVVITHSLVDGKRSMRSFYSPRDILIDYSNGNEEMLHKIFSPGPLTVDHEQQTITLQGDEEGQQVYIEDVMGDAYADFVFVDYTSEEGKIVPQRVILEGNVRLMNRCHGKREEACSVLHYALADKVECFPEQKEMLLTCSGEKRVLFFDKVNNIHMSAPSLRVTNDSETKKSRVQGVGDVRFTFIEKELEQFKGRFPFQKELKSAK